MLTAISMHLLRYSAKVEEGLSRLLAFLREEEERERLEEIERLKPIGTPVSSGIKPDLIEWLDFKPLFGHLSVYVLIVMYCSTSS